MKKSLIALSSVAVLSIYSAGYMRTRAAAERFSDEPARRPPALPAPPSIGPAPSVALAAGAHELIEATPVEAASAAPAIEAPAPEPAPAREAAAAPPAAAPATAPAAPAVEAASVPAAPLVDPVALASTGQSLASLPTVALAAPAAPQYKDGTYTGWGTCRHGDIQAKIVIEAGRIAKASISGCYTRYSCSWISALPPQVVARQSPETDYVSGATQSTNAFYYAVIEALAQAKK